MSLPVARCRCRCRCLPSRYLAAPPALSSSSSSSSPAAAPFRCLMDIPLFALCLAHAVVSRLLMLHLCHSNCSFSPDPTAILPARRKLRKQTGKQAKQTHSFCSCCCCLDSVPSLFGSLFGLIHNPHPSALSGVAIYKSGAYTPLVSVQATNAKLVTRMHSVVFWTDCWLVGIEKYQQNAKSI